MLKDTYILGTVSIVAVTVITGAFLSSVNVSADDTAIDNVSISVPVSCSLEGAGMTSHNANIVNGTYQADIGTTTIKTYCNDSEGFAIYAIGYTNNEYGKTVLTNTTLGSTADIVTGTATSGSTSNWAMKLTAPTSPIPTYPLTLDNSFGNYHAVPSEYIKVAHRDSSTDIGTNAEGSTLTTTYAAFMSQTQPAGTYIGQVRYTLVHPASEVPFQPVACEAGEICYNASSGTVQGQMGKQIPTSSELAEGITLWAPNFKRDGYGFAGWADYLFIGSKGKTGEIYGPNETITAPSNLQTDGLSLYAVWIKSSGSLQNWDGCSDLNQVPTYGHASILNVTALTDERDGNTYAVGRLIDGNCWMIENLRLADKDSSNNDTELSSTNTHNPSLPITNVYDATNPTTSNHLSATTDPTTTAWCQANSSACDDQSMLATNNTTLFTNNTSTSYSTESNVYSYGNYYNWYSATAGHGKYGSSYASGYIAPGDICPAGWHLPTGNTTGEYYALNTALNAGADDSTASNGLRSYPNNFVYSGGVNGSSVLNRSFFGRYWSSSALDSSYAYGLYFSSSYVYPGTYGSSNVKYSGRMVRCVAGV